MPDEFYDAVDEDSASSSSEEEDDETAQKVFYSFLSAHIKYLVL